MQYVDLSRYIEVKNPAVIPPFNELRNMKPVIVTHDLRLVDEDENINYAKSLAAKGITVVPILRQPPHTKFTDRMFFPRRILLEMTSRCNLLCKMCPQQNLTRPRMDMPGKLYRKLIDDIDSYGVEGIWLFNIGEPLLHPEFYENIRHISTKKNLGVIWLSTNGRDFTEEHIKAVLNSNIDYINISVHAVSEETYNTVVPPGNFKTVQANLEKFYELKGISNLPRKPFFHCQMIEQETTKHEIDAFIEKHYYRADVVSINILEYVGIKNNLPASRERERKPLTSCNRVTRNDCFIFSNGDVTLCDTAFNAEIYLGNIHKQSLYEIWNGEKRKNILMLNEQGKMSELDFCRNCLDYDL